MIVVVGYYLYLFYIVLLFAWQLLSTNVKFIVVYIIFISFYVQGVIERYWGRLRTCKCSVWGYISSTLIWDFVYFGFDGDPSFLGMDVCAEYVSVSLLYLVTYLLTQLILLFFNFLIYNFTLAQLVGMLKFKVLLLDKLLGWIQNYWCKLYFLLFWALIIWSGRILKWHVLLNL